jgi:hypothetical protein
VRSLVVALVLLIASGLRADKVDDLTRALMQDPSYKVRVQAALILGKLMDKRAVPALIQALKDENESVRGVAATSLGRLGDHSAANALQIAATGDSSEFVRTQARKALDAFANGGTPSAPPRAGARYYFAIGFTGGEQKGGREYAELVRSTLAKELQKVPTVTLSVAGAAGEPSASALSSHRLEGFIVDGNIQRLSSQHAGGQAQIDCDLKAYVATFPGRSIKMMTTEGASLQTSTSPSEEISAKKDCLAAAAGAVREDVEKFLSTLQ